MKVILTAARAIRVKTLVPLLRAADATPVVLGVHDCTSASLSIRGSVLDRAHLRDSLNGIDAIVHIAGWRGNHESRCRGDV